MIGSRIVVKRAGFITGINTVTSARLRNLVWNYMAIRFRESMEFDGIPYDILIEIKIGVINK